MRQVEAGILVVGGIASLWMVVLLGMKLKTQKSANRQIDLVLLFIAFGDLVCCTIKSTHKCTNINHVGCDEDTSRNSMYPVANAALLSSFLWQTVLTLLILRLIKYKGKSHLNIWVFHFIIWPIAITRGLQGYLENMKDKLLYEYYLTSWSFVAMIVICVLLLLIQHELKIKTKNKRSNAIFSRIRLFPVVYIITITPRSVFYLYVDTTKDVEREHYRVLDTLTRFLFYLFPLLNCLVYGTSQSCFSMSAVREPPSPPAELSSIDSTQVRFNRSDILGYGGAGVIYKGMYRGSVVAIKHIELSSFGCFRGPISEDSRLMFTQEASMLSRLVHPNIVYFMGAFIERTDGFIVVEYCNRGSLRSILDHFRCNGTDNTTVDWNWRCKIALGTARGLLYLHQTVEPSIIHRDLKSPNVLVNDYFTAKVADFGTARLMSLAAEVFKGTENKESTGLMTTSLGTARWTAPEILLGITNGQACYTEAIDIFSFGMILWELTTFQLPFDSLKFNFQVNDAVAQGARPSIPVLTARTRPRGWDNLIRACWAQSPEGRPSAAEIVEKLDSMLAPQFKGFDDMYHQLP